MAGLYKTDHLSCEAAEDVRAVFARPGDCSEVSDTERLLHCNFVNDICYVVITLFLIQLICLLKSSVWDTLSAQSRLYTSGQLLMFFCALHVAKHQPWWWRSNHGHLLVKTWFLML